MHPELSTIVAEPDEGTSVPAHAECSSSTECQEEGVDEGAVERDYFNAIDALMQRANQHAGKQEPPEVKRPATDAGPKSDRRTADVTTVTAVETAAREDRPATETQRSYALETTSQIRTLRHVANAAATQAIGDHSWRSTIRHGRLALASAALVVLFSGLLLVLVQPEAKISDRPTMLATLSVPILAIVVTSFATAISTFNYVTLRRRLRHATKQNSTS